MMGMPNRRRHGTWRHKRHLHLRLPSRKDWQRSWRNLRAARFGLGRFLARSKNAITRSKPGLDKYPIAGERDFTPGGVAEIPRRTPRAVWRNLVFVYLFVMLAAAGFAMGRLAPQLLISGPSRLGIGLLHFLDWSTGQVVPLATTFFDSEGNAAREILETAIPAMAAANRAKTGPPPAQVMARNLIRSVTTYDLGDPRSFFVSGLSSTAPKNGLPELPARGGPGGPERGGLSVAPGGSPTPSDLLQGSPRLPAGGRENEEESGGEEGQSRPSEDFDAGEPGPTDTRWQQARPGPARETAPVQLEPSALWARATSSEAAKLLKEQTALARRLAGIRWGSQPLVAIYHSHSSETYHGRNAHPMGKKDDRLDYAWGQTSGVISVGDELAYILTRKYKVPVIHSRNIHDLPLIREAYNNSLQTATKILRQYPSVVALFDLHRDGLLIAPDSEIAATIGGITVARVKIVVGKGRAEFPNGHWQKNMEFAEQIQAALEKRYPGLSRGIQVRDWPFNQQVQERALLFEIGDHFNTKEEALRSAVLMADVLAEVLAEVVQKQIPTMLRHS